jgi:hypothetical protein
MTTASRARGLHRFVTVGLWAALLAGSGMAAARDSDPADLSGYWMISFGAVPPRREPTPIEQSLIDELPPGTVLLADAGLPEFAPGDYGGLEIRPAALAAAKDYDPEVQRSLATTCQPPGLVYSMQGPFPIEIFQTSELIVIKMEYFDVVRIIFMGETEHPDDWPLSGVGHSIGQWESDTLVVHTARLAPATLFNNGLDHSERLRMIERFRLSEDGAGMVVTQQIEDPQVFAGRAARVLPFERGDGHVYPYECDPSYGLAIETRDRR